MNTNNPPDGPGLLNAVLKAIADAAPKLPTPERDLYGRPWNRKPQLGPLPPKT